jgi:hypothetical protein
MDNQTIHSMLFTSTQDYLISNNGDKVIAQSCLLLIVVVGNEIVIFAFSIYYGDKVTSPPAPCER